MTDPREIAGRLNPTNVRFDVGRGGGAPELANIDIAGALGMVPAGLGREVWEACWWPDGAALRRTKFHALVLSLAVNEMSRQREKVAKAELDVAIVESQVELAAKFIRGGATQNQLDELIKVEEAAERARGTCWPKNTLVRLSSIVNAIVVEIRGRHGGPEGEDRVPSDRRRAIAMGVDTSDYPKRWRPVYEWMLERMIDAEEEANYRMKMALRREAA